MPQTLAGAVWTALLEKYGCDFGKLAQRIRTDGLSYRDAFQRLCHAGWIADVRVRGPWFCRPGRAVGGSPDILVPVPAVLHTAKVKNGGPAPIMRLVPRRDPTPGWRDSAPDDQKDLRPLWLKHPDPTEAVAGFLTSDGLATFLAGCTPAASDVVNADELFTFDHRTGIEIIAEQLSAKEGGIYGASFLALRTPYSAREPSDDKPPPPPCSLYAEVCLPPDAPTDAVAELGVLSLGGEGRRVRVSPVTAFDWPRFEPTTPKQRPLLLMTTPGLLAGGWKPKCLDGRLLAAAVPGAVAVSGWDLARGGPKPTRFAAAAGSVYFLDQLPNDLPDALSDVPGDGQQGWGCFVQGVWKDE
jgi:CRISPR-associated protein Cmr3